MAEKRNYSVLVMLLTLLLFSAVNGWAGETSGLSRGQTIYVPAYSHIYGGNREIPILLTVTLSIRNVEIDNTIEVTEVNYHETKGALLKSLLEKPVLLEPQESKRFVIPEKDKAGGSGANFIVKWKSEKAVNPPIVETVMIGVQSQQGISFTSRGQAIKESD